MTFNLTDYEENRLLDLSALGTDKLHLMSTLGTESAAGTEVVGGSYAAQTLTFAAAAAGSKATSAALTFTSMPATDVQGWVIKDSAGTNRKWYGLWSPKSGTAQATGDTITATAHGYANTQKVVFQIGYAPTGLAANTTYFVVGSAANTFQVAATSGGVAIDITADSALCQFGVVKVVNATDNFNVASGALTVALD